MKIAVVLSAAALLLCTGVALAQPYAPPPLPPESGVPPPIPGPRGHFELLPGHWGTGPYGRWIWIEGHWVR